MSDGKIQSRKLYIDRIQPFINKPLIKVISGHRRVGKSYFIKQLINELRTEDPSSNIMYINKELYEFDAIHNYQHLQSYFDQYYQPNAKNYFFVDEIQEIVDYQKCIRNILVLEQADIFISGSNAKMLSGDLATTLSGRYIEIKIHPLAFDEFLSFFKLENTIESFNRYLKQGGMPGLLHVDNQPQSIADYLQGIMSSVVLKDIVSRYNIRNLRFLENLTKFLSDNVGSLVSAGSISKYVKSQQMEASPNMVLDYLSFLTNAFILNKAQRFEIIGKKVFEINEKYYFEDLGLRNFLVGFKMDDIAKLLENVVYNHLIIAGYKVYIGQIGSREIDFVAEKLGETIYVQVAYLLSEPSTFDREFGNLLKIPDNFKKIVVSLDPLSITNTYKGIYHYSVPEFCLKVMEGL